MKDIERRLRSMAIAHASTCDFLLVYIEEAHPVDGWAVRHNDDYVIKQHKRLKERIAAAKLLLVDPNHVIRVVVDSMDNQTNAAYAGFFERMYIIREGRVEYQGQVGPFGFKPHEVEVWLADFDKKI